MADVRDEARQIIAEALAQAVHEVETGGFYAYAEKALTALQGAHLAVVENTKHAGLVARAEKAEALLRELVDDTPCWIDDNGLCQAHRLHPHPCAQARTRQLLADLATT